MKLGVIGVGQFGQNHVRVLSEMGVLSCVADLNKEAVETTSAAYRVPGFTDPAELIALRPDGIVIATPAHTHFSLAKQVLEANIPCLVEKPMTLDVADGENLTALAAKKNLPLMVGHLLIYQPAIQFIKERLAEGLIGRLVGLHQERLNLGKARNRENVLWSLAVHDIAVALFLIGETPSKSAFFGQSVLTVGIEDDAYLHMRFASGVHATIHCSWLWPELRRRMTVVGEEGMITFDEPSGRVILARRRIDNSLKSVDDGEEVLFESSCQPLALELRHFMTCCREGSRPISDGLSGVEVMRVLSSLANR